MKNAALMCVSKRVRQRCNHSRRKFWLDRFGTRPLVKRLPQNELASDERCRIDCPGFEHGHNIWVRKRRCGPGFAFETVSKLAGNRGSHFGDLDRDLSIETVIEAAVNNAKATNADLFKDLDIAKAQRVIRQRTP